MRLLAMISALALAACTPPGARAPSEVSPASAQQYTPGVHVSGHVNVGVVRNF